MLDTLKLQSPYLEEDLARSIERNLSRRSSVHLGTGEVEYEIISGSLHEESWDSRVSLRVMRQELRSEAELVRVELPSGKIRLDEKKVTRMRLCDPYVFLEGSVHKAMLGHNVYGGPEGLQESCAWFCDDVASRLGVELPKASGWSLRRVDVAEAYDLGSLEPCGELLWGLNSAEYPRRSVIRYGSESIMAPGKTTAVKAYCKGLEFAKHDRKRLRSMLQADELQRLQQRANGLVRWEVSVKAHKLDADHDGKPLVEQVSDDYLRSLHYREVRRLVREGEAEVKTVRKQKQVRDRLYALYTPSLAGALLGTWHQLVTLGEKETRSAMSRPTFYRHVKQLKDSGVSWIGADVVVLPSSSIPEDLTFGERSRYRVRGEAPEVAAKLGPYRAA